LKTCFATFFCVPVRDTPAWPVWEALPGDAQFEMLRASVKAVEKQPEFVILTDPETPLPSAHGDTVIDRRPVDQQNFMLERTRRQADFLQQRPFDRPVVFADTDMLLISPLSDLFEQDFDIALTVRSNSQMPVNGGLILANSKRPEASRAFFSRLLSIMEEEALTPWREWYGDQYALAEILQGIDVAENIGRVVDAEGVRILLLDSSRYNFTPTTKRPTLSQDLRSITLYHFKGEYRLYMPFFWESRVKPGFIAPQKGRGAWLLEALALEARRKRVKRTVKADNRRMKTKRKLESEQGTHN